MNLATTVELFCGGPGSGCNPDKGKCGRRKGSGKQRPAYHGTSYEAAKKILREGLRVNDFGEVHASRNYDEALGYANVAKKRGKPLAIVVIRNPREAGFRSGGWAGNLIAPDHIPRKYIARVELYDQKAFKRWEDLMDVTDYRDPAPKLVPSKVLRAQEKEFAYVVVAL